MPHGPKYRPSDTTPQFRMLGCVGKGVSYLLVRHDSYLMSYNQLWIRTRFSEVLLVHQFVPQLNTTRGQDYVVVPGLFAGTTYCVYIQSLSKGEQGVRA